MIRVLVLFGLAASIAACAEEKRPSARETGEPIMTKSDVGPPSTVEMLVVRFDVEECADSKMLGAMGKTTPSGKTETVRTYQSDAECVAELKAAFDKIGFEQNASDVFSYDMGENGSERVTLSQSDDGTAFGIQWELFGA